MGYPGLQQTLFDATPPLGKSTHTGKIAITFEQKQQTNIFKNLRILNVLNLLCTKHLGLFLLVINKLPQTKSSCTCCSVIYIFVLQSSYLELFLVLKNTFNVYFQCSGQRLQFGRGQQDMVLIPPSYRYSVYPITHAVTNLHIYTQEKDQCYIKNIFLQFHCFVFRGKGQNGKRKRGGKKCDSDNCSNLFNCWALNIQL